MRVKSCRAQDLCGRNAAARARSSSNAERTDMVQLFVIIIDVGRVRDIDVFMEAFRCFLYI